MTGARWRLTVVIAVLASGAASGVGAQDAARADSAPQAPQPIPVDSIPDRASNAINVLGAQAGRVPSDSAVSRLDSTLAALRTRFDAEAEAADSARLATLFFEDLADLQGRWNQLRRDLDGWDGTATALAARLDALSDTIGAVQGRWRATRTASWRDMPASVREQVTAILQRADSLVRVIQPVRARVLAVQGDAVQLRADIEARLGQVQTAQARARRQLLRQDSPVLWKAFARADSAVVDSVAPADTAASPATTGRFALAVEYLAANRGRVTWQLAVFLLATAALWFLGTRRDQWATREFAIHWPSNLLAHPVAAGWILAIALSRTFYPGAPMSLLNLAFLAGIPAVAVLLRELLGHPLRRPAFVLLGVFAVKSAADAIVWDPVAARFILLALTGATLGAYVWFARLIRDRATRGRWWTAGWIGAQAAAGLLGIGVLANVFGFVTLANLLTVGTLASGLAGLALVALAEVLTGALLVASFATPAGRLQVIRRNRPASTRRITRLVQVVTFVFWLSVALRQYRLLTPVLDLGGAILRFEISIGSWAFTAGEIAAFLVTLVIAIWIARGLRAVLRYDVLPRLDVGRGVPEATSSIAYYVVLAAGVIFAAGAAGIEFGRLALIAGALGVGIGFGLQTIVSNFISGLILLFERPIQSGDTLELEGLRGEVRQIGIRASTVRTFQGADVIVPNQDLIAGRVINWTLSDQTRRVEVPIGVAYGSDPAQVMGLLQEVAEAHPKVLREPKPDVLFTEYGESALHFELRFWAGLDDWLHVRSDLLAAVFAAFREHGIEIPFPQRDLHVRSVDQGVRKLLDGSP